MKKILLLLAPIILLGSGCAAIEYSYECGEKTVKNVEITRDLEKYSYELISYKITLEDDSVAYFRGTDAWRIEGDGKLCVAKKTKK